MAGFLILAAIPPAALAQDLALDWATKKVNSCPANLTGSVLTVKVSNLNDVLYQYSVQAQVVASYPDDAASGAMVAKVSLAVGPLSSCDLAQAAAVAAEGALRTDFDKDENLKPKVAKGTSVLLASTLESWRHSRRNLRRSMTP